MVNFWRLAIFYFFISWCYYSNTIYFLYVLCLFESLNYFKLWMFVHPCFITIYLAEQPCIFTKLWNLLFGYQIDMVFKTENFGSECVNHWLWRWQTVLSNSLVGPASNVCAIWALGRATSLVLVGDEHTLQQALQYWAVYYNEYPWF